MRYDYDDFDSWLVLGITILAKSVILNQPRLLAVDRSLSGSHFDVML